MEYRPDCNDRCYGEACVHKPTVEVPLPPKKKYRVKVEGPATRHQMFGVGMYVVDNPTAVFDESGALIIELPPFPGRPATEKWRERKPTGPSRVVYPRGGWDRVVITEILEEDAHDDEA